MVRKARSSCICWWKAFTLIRKLTTSFEVSSSSSFYRSQEVVFNFSLLITGCSYFSSWKNRAIKASKLFRRVTETTKKGTGLPSEGIWGKTTLKDTLRIDPTVHEEKVLQKKWAWSRPSFRNQVKHAEIKKISKG